MNTRNQSRDARRAQQLNAMQQALHDAKIKPAQANAPLVTRLLQALHRASFHIYF